MEDYGTSPLLSIWAKSGSMNFLQQLLRLAGLFEL